eukprot:993687-Pyramimonas_sp.AAC.1
MITNVNQTDVPEIGKFKRLSSDVVVNAVWLAYYWAKKGRQQAGRRRSSRGARQRRSRIISSSGLSTRDRAPNACAISSGSRTGTSCASWH